MTWPFESFVVTPKHVAMRWSGASDGRWFRCHLCGRFFEVDDKARAVYSNFPDSPFNGNPLICDGAPGCGPTTDEDALSRLGAIKDSLPWWVCPWGTEPPGRPTP